MTEQIATNVHWHHGEISRADRYRVLGQKGATLWFTGFSGSGKSTVAVALEAELLKRGRISYRLDGDNIRLGINKNLGFSAADLVLKSLGLKGFQEAAQRAQLDGLLVLWHPAQ